MGEWENLRVQLEFVELSYLCGIFAGLKRFVSEYFLEKMRCSAPKNGRTSPLCCFSAVSDTFEALCFGVFTFPPTPQAAVLARVTLKQLEHVLSGSTVLCRSDAAS